MQRSKVLDYDQRFKGKVRTVSESSVFSGSNRITNYEYDNYMNVTSATTSGFTPRGQAVSRTQSYVYNGPYHQLTEIDGPRTDVDDRYSISYYADNEAEGNNRARIKTITAPLGVVLFDSITYTATGNTHSYLTGNNLRADLVYYPGNDRPESLTQTDLNTGQSRTVRWTYLETGEVESITTGYGMPEATVITFGYDDARRLIRVTDGFGNYISYTLDTEGNILDESIYDVTGSLKKALTKSYDIYNQLDISMQMNESFDLNIAPDGMLDLSIDGKGVITDYSYDALQRLTSIEQDKAGSNSATANALTQMAYDVQDNLVSVVDPNNGTTTYVYDDMGNLLSRNSPDTGLTTFTYNEAGNAISMIDAKGQLFNYGYDALGRVTSIDAPGADADIEYTYDSCSNGVGRICSITRNTTVLSYSYTAFGDISTIGQSVESFSGWQSVNTQLAYEYDAAGRIKTTIYPSGNRIAITYDAAGKPYSQSLNGGEVDLVSSTSYHPFGQLREQYRGNGIGQWNFVDQAYRDWLKGNGSVFYEYTSSYDENGNPMNIIFMDDSNAHQFDAHNRLDQSIGSYGAKDYVYDKAGNRTQLLNDGVATDYSYEPESNRMNTAGGDAVVLDANGNTTSLRDMSLIYTSDNRLKTIIGQSDYQHNGRGERVMKAYNKGGASAFFNAYKTVFVYGSDGKLLAEYGPTGQVRKEYVYFNGELNVMLTYSSAGNEPILNADMDGDGAVGIEDYIAWYLDYYVSGNILAEVTGDGIMDSNDMNAVIACAMGNYCVTSSYDRNIYYSYNDHLGTPRALTNESGVKVWKAKYDPFGKATVNEDVDGDGVSVELNVRFPGQYYDGESGLHYNYYRTYDAEFGRYITSDPIGLEVGINTYIYVENNPLNYIDPLGLYKNCTRPLKGSTYGQHGYIKFDSGATISWGPASGISGPGKLNTNDSGGICGEDNGSTPEEDQNMMDWAIKHEKDLYFPVGYNCFNFRADAQRNR